MPRIIQVGAEIAVRRQSAAGRRSQPGNIYIAGTTTAPGGIQQPVVHMFTCARSSGLTFRMAELAGLVARDGDRGEQEKEIGSGVHDAMRRQLRRHDQRAIACGK